VNEEHRQSADGEPEPVEVFSSRTAAGEAADRMRQHASGPLYVVEVGDGATPDGWLVLTAASLAGHPRRSALRQVAEVEPPRDEGATVEVTFTPPDSLDLLSLGTMAPTQAMALLELLQDADGVVLRRADAAGEPQKLPPPTGYVVVVDGARPDQLTVRTTYGGRRRSGHGAHDDLGVPGGDPHAGPASLVVVLDHWAEEHGYRLVHTPEQLNQPVEEFVAGLSPDERQRVVIVEESEEDGIVRIGEALSGTMEVFEIAAMSEDWLATLPLSD
jgi:hypothetical protein